jgi:hypothetical protein
MVMLIEHIDAIGRRKRRDVLYLQFHPLGADGPYGRSKALDYNPDRDETRQAILAWLDAHHIPWSMCGSISDTRVMDSYRGQVHIDVPFDDGDPTYCSVRDYLEHPDGSIRHEGVRFYVVPLAQAMENAVHDTPGFWENWAKGF